MSLYKENPARSAIFYTFRWGKLIVLGFFLASTLVMYGTFLQAYFTPEKVVLVTINSFGEANFEIAFFTVLILFSVVIFFPMLNEEANKLHETKTF